jgi:hypothetical protein
MKSLTKKQKIIIGAIILLFMLAFVWRLAIPGGPPPCTVFAEWSRHAGSTSIYPERTGHQYELVQLLDCNGQVRVTIDSFDLVPQQQKR